MYTNIILPFISPLYPPLPDKITVTEDIIKIVSTHIITAVIIATAVDIAEKTGFISLSPNISEMPERRDKAILQIIHSVRRGRNRHPETIITKTPAPDLRSSRLPLNAPSVSPSTFPTMGTKEPTTYLRVRWLILSRDDEARVPPESAAVNIPIRSTRIHLTLLYTASQNDENLSFPEIDEVTESARNTFIIGSSRPEASLDTRFPVNINTE